MGPPATMPPNTVLPPSPAIPPNYGDPPTVDADSACPTCSRTLDFQGCTWAYLQFPGSMEAIQQHLPAEFESVGPMPLVDIDPYVCGTVVVNGSQTIENVRMLQLVVAVTVPEAADAGTANLYVLEWLTDNIALALTLQSWGLSVTHASLDFAFAQPVATFTAHGRSAYEIVSGDIASADQNSRSWKGRFHTGGIEPVWLDSAAEFDQRALGAQPVATKLSPLAASIIVGGDAGGGGIGAYNQGRFAIKVGDAP